MTVATRSPWSQPTTPEMAPPLRQDEEADVCVIGAGIAGLATAFLLARGGRSVVVLDANESTGGGETRLTTAHLACVLDDRFTAVEKSRGETVTHLARASHAAAIDWYETTVRELGIDCGFRRLDGYLYLSPDQTEAWFRDEEKAAVRAGAPVLAGRSPLSNFANVPCLRFADQATLHPGRFIAGLRRAAEQLGVRFFGKARVNRFAGGSPTRVITEDGHVVSASALVVATNTPVHTRLTHHTVLSAYTTYAFSARIPQGSVPDALYWDTADPYHYVRVLTAAESGESDDQLIIGGEDHKTGQEDSPQNRWEKLEAWARQHFPTLGAVCERWSGQVMETPDGLALLGNDPAGQKNTYIIAGDSGMGLTHGVVGALLLRDLLTTGRSDWSEVYDPTRTYFTSAGEYAREALNAAWQYTDWLTSGTAATEADIAPDSGAVVRHGLHKRAVFRDAEAKLHICSAICPHLGGVVRWNAAEKTWDCPVHGSRFNTEGEVVHGPAVTGLDPLSVPENR